MDCQRQSCDDCPERLLCHCLQITEEMVVSAVNRMALGTVHEVRDHTGAGDGCTSCHARIREVIEQHTAYLPSPPDICSVR